jgi:hypothetical protein
LLRPTSDEDQAEAWRQTFSLAGLMLTLLIVVVSLIVIRELQISTVLQGLFANQPLGLHGYCRSPQRVSRIRSGVSP